MRTRAIGYKDMLFFAIMVPLGSVFLCFWCIFAQQLGKLVERKWFYCTFSRVSRQIRAKKVSLGF